MDSSVVRGWTSDSTPDRVPIRWTSRGCEWGYRNEASYHSLRPGPSGIQPIRVGTDLNEAGAIQQAGDPCDLPTATTLGLHGGGSARRAGYAPVQPPDLIDHGQAGQQGLAHRQRQLGRPAVALGATEVGPDHEQLLAPRRHRRRQSPSGYRSGPGCDAHPLLAQGCGSAPRNRRTPGTGERSPLGSIRLWC